MPKKPTHSRSRPSATPIPQLLALLRRQDRIPEEASEHADRIGTLPEAQQEQALVAAGVVTEEDIAQAVAQDTGLPFQAINALELNPDVVTGALPAPFARRHTICALSREADTLTVALANPYEQGPITDLERYLGVRVEVVVATRSDIEGINGSLYNLRTSLRAAENELAHEDRSGDGTVLGTQEFVSESEAAGDLEPTTRPVVAALDSILHQAFENRASDIHLEPKRDRAVVRFRVDGVLRTMHTFPRIVYQAVVSRLKMLSGLDIAEKRRPQDGRFKRIEPDKEIEMRVSVLPTVFGEKAVLRVFDPSALVSSLDQLRLAADESTRLREMLSRREGLVLVTGPTGSGKTTTLYSVLRHVATPEVNVITIEDPVELIHPPLSQVQVNPRIGFGFAEAIRSVLRQDPDILMVGEIRDDTTAEMAVQAALTGHLVLSTLHTNDAPGSVTRLSDLGVPRFLIGTTLVGVVAQRLVRTICPRCAVFHRLDKAQAATLEAPGIAGLRVRRGRGCARCRDSGYRGRRAVFEILTIDTGASALILNDGTSEDLARYARGIGCRSLRQSAVRLLLAGETTLTEVVRVTGAGPDPGFGSAEDLVLPGPRPAASVTEASADDKEQGRNAVERSDDIPDREGAAPDGDPGEETGRTQGDPAYPAHRVDERDCEEVEEEVDDSELKAPVSVRSGNSQSGKKGGDRRTHIGTESYREGVVEEQKAGTGERDEHRGLDQDRDDRAHSHGRQGVAAEHPVDDRLAATRGKALEGADKQPERHHQQEHRKDGQDGGSRLVRGRDDAGEPLDGRRHQLDDAPQRALVIESVAQHVSEDPGHHSGKPRQETGRHFERQKNGHSHEVEEIVAGRHGEGPPQFLPVPQVSESGDRIRDRRPDVGSHHHGDRALEGQGRLGRRDQPDDQGTRDRGTLHEGGCQNPDQEADKGVRRSREEAVEEPGAEPFEPLRQTVNRSQEEQEENNQAEESGELTGEPPTRVRPAFGHSPASRTGSAASEQGPQAAVTGTRTVFRFEMDE